MKRLGTRALFAVSPLVAAALASAPATRARAAEPAATDAERDEARRRFERGVALLKDGALDAALAEFQASRALAPTRGNTRNAAVVLRKLHRFDEALDLFEALRGLPETSGDGGEEREAIAREIDELRALVGAIEVRVNEPGARVSVDGRERGVLPLAAPLRVSAGAHVVRIVREGRVPLETRVEIAGRSIGVVEGSLVSVAQLGHLRVEETTGAGLDVVLDGKMVGKSPWEGTAAAGEHVVWLRGPAGIGTAPAAVTVRADELSTSRLAATRLDAQLHVESEAGGVIAVDGVAVASGSWDGALPGGAHRVEVRVPGRPVVVREVTLVSGETARIMVSARDASETPRPFRVLLEAAGGLALASPGSVGGDVGAACVGACARETSAGALARLGVGAALPSGLALGLEGGFLRLRQQLDRRPDVVLPNGRAPASGVASDTLGLSTWMVGAAGSYTRGERWRVGGRLALGVAFASVRDDRDGVYDVGGTSATTGVTRREGGTYAYALPEVRVGYRLGARVTVGVSLGVLAMVAAHVPRRAPTQDEVLLSTRDFGTYPDATLAGGLILVAVPSLVLVAEL